MEKGERSWSKIELFSGYIRSLLPAAYAYLELRRTLRHTSTPDIYLFVSPCVGGSKVPPRTLYRIKCVLAEILYGCQNKMAASTLRVKNSCAKPASISNTRHRQV